MTRKKRKYSRWLILILLLTGIILMLFPTGIRFFNNYSNIKQFNLYQQDISKQSSKEISKRIDEIKSCYEASSKDLSDPFSNNQTSLDCLKIGDTEVFGMLEVPILNLKVPIYLNSGDNALNKGVGLVSGSSLPIGGNGTHTVLAGHRGLWTQEMLRHADKIVPGELFYLHVLGEKLTYRVFTQTVIEPYNTDVLEIESEKDLATLITCHPFPTDKQRLLIRSERVN